MQFDPNKVYAELGPYSNIVVAVGAGTFIPDWAMPGRHFIEVPQGATVRIGDRYNGEGSFDTPTLSDPIVVMEDAYKAAVQLHLDKRAVAKGYDNIFTAVTYADEPTVPQFQTDGQAFRAWRSRVWAYCYQKLNDVMNGAPAPTIPDFLAQLDLNIPPPP